MVHVQYYIYVKSSAELFAMDCNKGFPVNN